MRARVSYARVWSRIPTYTCVSQTDSSPAAFFWHNRMKARAAVMQFESARLTLRIAPRIRGTSQRSEPLGLVLLLAAVWPRPEERENRNGVKDAASGGKEGKEKRKKKRKERKQKNIQEENNAERALGQSWKEGSGSWNAECFYASRTHLEQ